MAGAWALEYVVIIDLMALDMHQFPSIAADLVKHLQVPPVKLPWVLRPVRLPVKLAEIGRPFVRAQQYRIPVMSAAAIVNGNPMDD
jgi:hypothetical protein